MRCSYSRTIILIKKFACRTSHAVGRFLKWLYLESGKEREQEQFAAAVKRFTKSQLTRQYCTEYLQQANKTPE